MNKPKKMLISDEDINRICDEYIKKNRMNNVLSVGIGIVIPGWLSFILLSFDKWDSGKTLYLITLVIITIIFICLLIYVIKNKNNQSIADTIKQQAMNDSDYSALFIISKIRVDSDGRKNIQILVRKKETWNCDFLPHIDINKDLSLEDQIDYLKNGLASKLNVQSKNVKIQHINDAGCYSIKLSVPEGVEKLFNYEFYTVSLDSFLEANLIENENWIDIDSLSNNVNVMRVNGDVIDNLMNLKSRIVDSFVFENEFIDNPIKIIWNITNKCCFDCDICATKSDQREELTLAEKSQALFSILTIKDYIKELNFAGGDPLICKDSKKIIRFAMNSIDKNRISITTTGEGIEKLNESEKSNLLNNTILTIDSPDLNYDGIRKSENYNKINYRNAKKFKKYFSKLRINVPILKTDLSNEQIKKLASYINEINPNEVSLIKLMPVGKQKNENYPKDYNPKNFIEVFNKELNKNIRFHLHCALRCDCKNEKCNMLSQKIGIDCSGNVFACCWAGYLECEPQNNPYYLGNLLKSNLYEILKSDKAEDLKDRIKKNNCNIFEYINN